MITERDIEIGAPPSLVWQVYSDVQRWPEWTESVTSVEPLDDATIEVGHRFRIRQPRMPVLVWEVTEVEPGASWTWEQRSAGSHTRAWHQVRATADGAVAVLGIDQRGALGALVARLVRGMTVRYLELEAHGLKTRSEARHRDATAA